MKRIILAFLLAIATITGNAAICPDQFYNAAHPEVKEDRLMDKAMVICYQNFAVLHSGKTRTPLWSAEVLTAEMVDGSDRIGRRALFHMEKALPLNQRSAVSDYTDSGWDKGHMTPADDMPTAAAQRESFSMANMVPQNPKNNQILWRAIESTTRKLAKQHKKIYVVTGPIYSRASKVLNGRVTIPDAIFKAIYIPSENVAAVYTSLNTSQIRYKTISVAQLERQVGFDVFPDVAPEVKSIRAKLPVPKLPRSK
jgi:endonuclease G